jgi:SOS-response transcriptional repressor LexA
MSTSGPRRAEWDPSTERIYAYIVAYIGERGFAPSFKEIAAGCHFSRASILRHLDKLEAWGWIAREPGVARSITLARREADR